MTDNSFFKQVIVLHPWIGKLLGAFFGFLAGGPVGILLGLFIGNFFDKGLNQYLNNPLLRYYFNESTEIKNVYVSVLFKVMGHIAKCDGQVTQEEINFSNAIMKELNLHPRERRLAIDYFNQGKQPNFHLERQLTLLCKLCQHQPILLQLFTAIIYRLSLKSPVTHGKQTQLALIFKRLGFAPTHQAGQQYQSQQQQHSHQQHYAHRPHGQFVDDYQLLGVKPTSSKMELKRAYRKKIGQFHPDRLIARKASQQEIKRATEKSQQIQAAYDRIKQFKGY